jgi:sugar/nucleoside kinase (ribokinase family)
MDKTQIYSEIDYLIIGHVTKDITPRGHLLGGTAAYAGLTALMMGLRVGLITSCNPEFALDDLDGISIKVLPSENTTSFYNIDNQGHRIQYIYKTASNLDTSSLIPDAWRYAPIVHFAPVAQEVAPSLLHYFSESFIGLTLQGWLRSWNEDGRIMPCEWYESDFALEKAKAAVLSLEDINGEEYRIDEFSSSIRIIAVTEGHKGARVYWNGDLRNIQAPEINFLDSTGAGDIFAAAFFIKLKNTNDPWESARFATQLATISTTRFGLQSIPTKDEIQHCQMEIVEGQSS